MPVGSAYAGGYNATRKQARSFMPAVNSLSTIIAQRKRRAGGGGRMTRVAGRIKGGAERADEFFAENRARDEQQYQRRQMEEQQQAAADKEERAMGLMEKEEARRQEAHELEQQKQEQAMAQQGETFDRATKSADRSEAYEMVKQGIMMRDAKTVNAALQQLAPQGPDSDVITESETEGGARKFTGRPAEGQAPQFIFDPDSDVVGVIFPGQEKPTVFKSPKEAFQNVLAPMNPAHEQSKDQITAAKNRGEMKFKNRKLGADNHFKAHEAAMKQFYSDGYYQPAMYTPDKYEEQYWRHIGRAENMSPEEAKATFEPPPKPEEAPDNQGGQEGEEGTIPRGAYTGDKPPKSHPNAKRAPNGAWYIRRGNGWAPILQGKGKKKKTAPKPKGQMSHAGVPNIVRKKVPAQPGIGG